MADVLVSALLIEVSNAEAAVGEWRARLDWSAARGIPAHVTVLYPFMPPDLLDDQVVARVGSVCAAQRAFQVIFDRTAWFDDAVLYLRPRQVEPFRALTAALAAQFPRYPPYRGRHAAVVPHLTVADQGTVPDKRAAERSVQPLLPITHDVEAVSIYTQAADGRWSRLTTCPLLAASV